MAKATWINVEGTWKQVKNIWQNVNGAWKQKVVPKGNIAGIWKEFIAYTLQKILSYDFTESTSQSMSNTFNFPNLISIDEITVDTGIVSHTRSGDSITVNVTNGVVTRSIYDSTKYSIYKEETRDSSSNSFNSSISSSSSGYSGTLYSSGNSYIISGSYTSSDSKYVTGQTSSIYNSDGYSGTLTQYVESGSYIPAESKYVTSSMSWVGSTAWYDDHVYTGTLTETTTKQLISSDTKTVTQSGDGYTPSISYDDGNYCGSLSWSNGQYSGTVTRYQTVHTGYSGIVTKPAIDTRVYRYQGTVTRPAYDTRVYRQNYAGYLYQGGYTNYYKYKINIKYTIANTVQSSSYLTKVDVSYKNGKSTVVCPISINKNQTEYTVDIIDGTTSVTMTTYSEDANAKILVNDNQNLVNGQVSSLINVVVGARIPINVTSNTGSDSKTYGIKII